MPAPWYVPATPSLGPHLWGLCGHRCAGPGGGSSGLSMRCFCWHTVGAYQMHLSRLLLLGTLALMSPQGPGDGEAEAEALKVEEPSLGGPGAGSPLLGGWGQSWPLRLVLNPGGGTGSQMPAGKRGGLCGWCQAAQAFLSPLPGSQHAGGDRTQRGCGGGSLRSWKMGHACVCL